MAAVEVAPTTKIEENPEEKLKEDSSNSSSDEEDESEAPAVAATVTGTLRYTSKYNLTYKKCDFDNSFIPMCGHVLQQLCDNANEIFCENFEREFLQIDLHKVLQRDYSTKLFHVLYILCSSIVIVKSVQYHRHIYIPKLY